MTIIWGHLAFSWNREQWPCELIHARRVVRTNQKALSSVFFSSTIFFICFFLQVPTPEIWAHNLYLDLSSYGNKITSATEESLSLHLRIKHPGFHVKNLWTFWHQLMALACPTCDSKIVEFLHHTFSSSVTIGRTGSGFIYIWSSKKLYRIFNFTLCGFIFK